MGKNPITCCLAESQWHASGMMERRRGWIDLKEGFNRTQVERRTWSNIIIGCNEVICNARNRASTIYCRCWGLEV